MFFWVSGCWQHVSFVAMAKRKQAPKGGDKGKRPQLQDNRAPVVSEGVPAGSAGQVPAIANTTPPPATHETIFSLRTGTVIQAPPGAGYITPTMPAPEVVGSHLVEKHECTVFFEDCQRNGRIDREELLVQDITGYVRKDLFPKLKFVMNDRLLVYSTNPNSICSLVCQEMGLKDPNTQIAYWERFKGMIGNVLNLKRNDVTGSIKRAFMGKSMGVVAVNSFCATNARCAIAVSTGAWREWDRKGKTGVTLEALLQLSTAGEPYLWLCSTLLPFVVGKKKWRQWNLKTPVSEIAICSDEAFVLLVLENKYSRWVTEAKWLRANRDKAEEEQAPKQYPEAKYTNSGISKKNGRSKRNQGWSREGHVRFNELYSLVQADRLKRARFEQELLSLMQQDVHMEESEDDEEPEEEELFPANDLGGLTAPTPIVVPAPPGDQYDPDREF